MNNNEELNQSSKQFRDIYRSKVELTGEKLKIIRDFDMSARPLDSISYDTIDEVSIKMPRDEYERFMLNWSQYLNLLYVSKYNQTVNEEFNKIHMLVQLLK